MSQFVAVSSFKHVKSKIQNYEKNHTEAIIYD